MTDYVSEDLTDRPLADLVSLAGKVAVVTGAARGIGEAIATRLAEAGATVAIGDLNAQAAASTAQGIGERAAAVTSGLALDIADEASVQEFADAVVQAHGRIDIWVNNAGIYPPTGDPTLASEEHLRKVIDVNVVGTFLASREAAKRMQGGSVIVNVISTAGLRASKGTMAYVVSKHAVVGLTKSLALELGKKGIRVTAVAPEVTLTPGVAESTEALAKSGYEAGKQQALNLFGRRAQPDDIARVVFFLASDLATWVTGSVVGADAGRLAALG